MENKNQTPQGFISTFGHYEKLLTYQKAVIIFDNTSYFTERFYSKYDRTIDQMVQAARSGKQNIVEGSMASGTSKEMELKLTNVARSSFEELKKDYEDFLRVRKLPIWEKHHRLVQRFRELNRMPGSNHNTLRPALEHESPEICANAAICLINVESYLLFQQLKKLESDFLRNGGLREKMFIARTQSRSTQ